MMNNEILNLLETHVPRSIVRNLVGNQFFDALVHYDLSQDIYCVDVLAYKVRMSKAALKKVFQYSSGSLFISEKQFIEKYYLKKVIKEHIELPSVTLKRKLHSFQYRAYRTVLQKLLSGDKKILLHLPTGAGKTRTASEILLSWLTYRRISSVDDGRVMFWIAQSSELCQQAYQTLLETINTRSPIETEILPLWGAHDNSDFETEKSCIYVVTVQKLANLIKEADYQYLLSNTDLVIFDEAHFVGEKWYEVLDWFAGSLVPILGLTATPGGEDVGALSTFYSHNKVSLTDESYQAYDDPIGFLRRKGYLAELEVVDIETDLNISLNKGLEDFEMSRSTIKKMVTDQERNKLLINAIQSELESNKKILVFACSVDHCYFLKSVLENEGYYSEVIEGNTENRGRIIERFKSKDSELNCLLNFNVLTAGFDAPNLNTLIVARPVSSVVQYSQMVGRVLRGPSNGGNRVNKLITLKDNILHGDYNEMLNRFNEYYL